MREDLQPPKGYVNCTGDACVGDHVWFLKAKFEGGFYRPRYRGKTEVFGKIVKDSYGAVAQQHTFTIEVEDSDKKMRIKGRNLYRYGLWRRLWDDEEARKAVLAEKHQRGELARQAREERKQWG